jgi:amino acid transporter
MIYEHQTGRSATVIAIISLLSVINGALIQIVMASRVLYGLSEQQWIPAFFGRVNKITRTPINATLIVSSVILLLVLWLPLLSLAKLTSLVTLVVFSLINLALFIIKLKGERHEAFSIPIMVPLLGFMTCGSFVIFQIYQVLVN